MTRRNITGIDHCIVLVRDLDAAAAQYARLGFTISPRGLHPADHGTGNNTVMFDNEYVELLGVVAVTPSNEHWRKSLTEREGLSGLALQVASADAAAEEMRADGIALTEPANFSRPVNLPDGGKAQASFRTTQFPKGIAPGFHLFCCQHLSRKNTWVPELLKHANTAYAIDSVTAATSDPAADGAIVGRLFAARPQLERDGGMKVDTGNAPIRFQTRPMIESRYEGADLTGINSSGLVSLVIKVRSAAAVEAALSAGETPYRRTAAGICVAPRDACGVILVFREI